MYAYVFFATTVRHKVRVLFYRLWWKIRFTAFGFWLESVVQYLQRIWFCHHNARVLADMEYRLGCVLSHTTRCMSKPYYTLQAMYTEIDDLHQYLCEQAVDDYKRDHDCTCDEEEAS